MKLNLNILLLSFCGFFLYACCEIPISGDNFLSKKKGSTKDSINNVLIEKRDKLLKKFEVTNPNESGEDFYHLFLYDSFDSGISVKFKQVANEYYLEVKTLYPDDSSTRLAQVSFKMEESEWKELENLIDEFDFWSADQLRINYGVLDGYLFILEGSRLTNDEALYNLIGRGSPRYDKMGALCEYIIRYKENLIFDNTQISK